MGETNFFWLKAECVGGLPGGGGAFWRRVLALMTLSLLTFTTGCGDAGAYAQARELERKVRVANPEATYDDPGYIRVAQALERVPRGSEDYPKATEQLGLIRDARRLAAGTTYNLDYLPERLQGKTTADFKPTTEGPPPARPEPVAAAPSSSGRTDPAPSEPAQVAVRSDAHVILYSTTWCGYCRKARAYFTRNNIPFVEKDVEADAAAAMELQKKVGSYSGVPVIDIDGVIIRGYDLAAIKRALSASDHG